MLARTARVSAAVPRWYSGGRNGGAPGAGAHGSEISDGRAPGAGGGRVGMATVSLARDPRHDRPVALKVLHPERPHALGPERFLQEIKLAARLQHPHILGVLDSGEASTGGTGGGRLWFTMPYVEGES